MSDEENAAAGDEWADALNEQKASEEGSGEQGDPWAEALSEQQEGENEAKTQENPLAALPTLEEGQFNEDFANNHPDLDIILDIPVNIAMEVGSTEISIRNLLHLNQGSVIELDRFAGEPLDVLVNGTLIAHGEVVVVNEKFGIRLTDILSAAERIAKIR